MEDNEQMCQCRWKNRKMILKILLHEYETLCWGNRAEIKVGKSKVLEVGKDQKTSMRM